MNSIIGKTNVIATLLIVFILLACSSDETKTETENESETETTTSGLGNGLTNAATVTTCNSESGFAKILCLANAFKATLNASQIATLQRAYSISVAKSSWSNLPGVQGRVGLRFEVLTNEQISYAKALIQAASGTGTSEGYNEINGLLAADETLGGNSYGSGLYYIAFHGTPSATNKWELQFGGHHLAFANTYSNGALVGATPSFRGIEPFNEFTYDGVTYSPVNQERDAFATMLQSLSTTELTTAKLSGIFSDILAGPGSDNVFPSTASGLQVGTLSTAKQTLVLNAIKTYVEDIDSENAASILLNYTNELANTYIAYSGTTAVASQNDYVRIDGPSVWIEFSMQRGVVYSPNHPHSVWRDKTNDYGGN
ncbi:DUF3500 domain-containing protein [Mariniflexile jejuense]|uniref:DUF3500 domain-containing protein n=1 Tax=Mariniflexile jejuense TaxID=1173582 RepID=A0ABW3JEQ5_9FLAO